MGAVERRTASFSHPGGGSSGWRSICYARPSVRSIDGAVPGTVQRMPRGLNALSASGRCPTGKAAWQSRDKGSAWL